MKRIFLSLLLLFMLFSCDNAGWTSDEENTFMKQCVSTAEKKSNNNEVAKKYCDCMLQKLKKKYSSYEKANLALGTDQGKMQEMAMECKP